MELPKRSQRHTGPAGEGRPTTPGFVVAVAGVTLAILILGFRATPPVLEQFHYNDFGTFYRAAASGQLYGPDPYLPVAGSFTAKNLNPPHFHLLFRPLTLLPLPQAYVVWLILTAGMIGLGLWRSARLVRPAWPWWMWAVMLAWTPFFSLVYTGQITALVFVPLVLAWWADREMRPAAAGVWLGLAVSLKPHLVLLVVWWVFRRRWRSVAMAIVTGAAVAVCGAVAYGRAAYATWLSHLAGVAALPWGAMNCSLWALPSRLWHATPYYANIAERPDLVAMATLFLVTPVALATLVGLRKVRSPDTSWALALSATFIVIPLGWAYYAWWWVPMTMGLPLSRRTWAVVAVCLTIPVGFVSAFAKDSVLLTMTVASAPVYGSAVLWVSILRLALAESPQDVLPDPGIKNPEQVHKVWRGPALCP